MSCGLHTKFDKAVDAVKEAFKAAVDTKDFDRSTLSEVWRHYQGLQTIAEGLPSERPDLGPDLVNIQFPDGTYNPDYNITVPTGDDNISFDTNNLPYDPTTPITFGETGTVTVPDSEDDAKIVL